MSHQQFYETVQREEEWEHDMKMKTYKERLHEELTKETQEYCCYCGQQRYSLGCCGEVHFVTYKEMDKEWQEDILENQLEEYIKWSEKQ